MSRPSSRTIAWAVVFATLITSPVALRRGVSGQEKTLVFQGGYGGNNFELLWKWIRARLEQDRTWRGTIQVVPSDGVAGLDALRTGRADFTLVKAPATVGLAYRGAGLFAHAHRNVRAWGLLPVPDWLTFAVKPGVDVETVGELLRRGSAGPLRIATGRDSPRDIVTYLLEEILRLNGTSVAALEKAGGGLVRLEPGASVQAALDGKVDAVFQEAQSIPIWDELFKRGWRVLSIDAPTLRALESGTGFGSRTIPREWHRSARDVRTIDFANVLLCVRAEVPDETVRWVTRTFLDGRAEVERMFVERARPRPWLTPPIDPAFFASASAVPYHAGARLAFGRQGSAGLQVDR